MNIEQLKSLQKRIQEATGADRELDALIAAAFLGGEAYHMPAGHEGFRWVRRAPVDNAVFGPAPYTSDPDGLGACVALMRSQFPDANWERVQRQMGICGIRNGPQWSHWGKPLANDCLTLLDAIVSALIAEEEAKEKADV